MFLPNGARILALSLSVLPRGSRLEAGADPVRAGLALEVVAAVGIAETQAGANSREAGMTAPKNQ